MSPAPGLVEHLKDIDSDSATVLLVHLAADALVQERRDGEPRFCGTAESLAMEVICNNLFNDRDDNGDLLARYRLLWKDYGTRLTRVPLRRPPTDLLYEATDVDLDDMTTLAFAYWAHVQSCRPGTQVRLNATIMPSVTIDTATIETFLSLFASAPGDLAAELRGCLQPWQMLPIQDRPFLRLGNDVVVRSGESE